MSEQIKGAERVWVRVTTSDFGEEIVDQGPGMYATAFDTYEMPGTWREYVRADLAGDTHCVHSVADVDAELIVAALFDAASRLMSNGGKVERQLARQVQSSADRLKDAMKEGRRE